MIFVPRYFTLSELCQSDTARRHGITNIPDFDATNNLRQLVIHVLDPLRDKFGHAISVTSGYRCPELNALVKGSNQSHHMHGMAADIVPSGQLNNPDVIKALYAIAKSNALNLPFCQCILEHRRSTGAWWVHISYKPDEHDSPRRQSFTQTL